MSIDMSQFHDVFFEESQEHLDEMEHLLMDLDLDEPDPEDLNSIFRAAHSIKGGSGIFGFDALTGLTHVMENLLDKARKGHTRLTTPIVDTLLSTVDLLKSILDCYKAEEEIDWNGIEKGSKALDSIIPDNEQKVDHSHEEEDGYGFFDGTPNVPESEDESFGFFDDEPEQQKQSSTKQDDDEEGFGFFEPLEDSSTDNKRSDEVPKPISSDEEGFGFFEPLEDNQASELPSNTTVPTARNTEAPAKQTSSNSVISRKTNKPDSPKTTPSKNKASNSKENTSIRVDTVKIDSLVNLVGELVITQSMIKMVGSELVGAAEEKLDVALLELSRNIREIQEGVMSMRMLPMSFAFNRFPRVVRDLAGKLEKKVELIIEGGHTEIDKGMIEKLVDPLTHLVRNSIDHGIEMPAKRKEKGKDEKGTVILRAEQRGSSIIISIVDDGGGLNRSRILSKAIENGLDADESMSDGEVWKLIFKPGFSTAEEVTDVSGRGVGMDVVRRNIESIGGNIDIKSQENKGSSIDIRLPLTLAIVDGMCITVADQTFVIPLTNIVESMQPKPEQLKSLSNDNLLWVREEYWPIVALHNVMNFENAITDPSQAIVVLIETSNKRFGLLVDALAGQQQVVIKSLEQHYKKVPGVAGATIMGDGSVALILDVETLGADVKQYKPNGEMDSE